LPLAPAYVRDRAILPPRAANTRRLLSDKCGHARTLGGRRFIAPCRWCHLFGHRMRRCEEALRVTTESSTPAGSLIELRRVPQMAE